MVLFNHQLDSKIINKNQKRYPRWRNNYMKLTKVFGSVGVVSAAALALVACGQKTSNNAGSQEAKKFKEETPVKPVKKGGTLSYAIETDTPFTGLFNNELSTSQTDSDVSQFGNEALFDTDDSYKINNKGPATFKLDRKAKTITIEVKKGVKWSDGKQVTAKDVEYEYEIMANKASKSQRYTASLQNIVGMTEYHDGKAKTISGIQMPDGENGRKVVLHFKEMKPGMLQSGNGYFLETASPYHQLKNIPFSKLESSDAVRKNPLFFGPFQISKIVRGQSVTWVPNKYYWRGTPKLNKITVSVVNPNSASQAIKSHKFDIAGVINSQWQQVKDTKGVNFVAKIPLSYSYMGFKVGKWEDGKNVMDPKAKMNNKSLRQAMAYAMNIDAVEKRYTQGLTFRIPTLIPAIDFINSLSDNPRPLYFFAIEITVFKFISMSLSRFSGQYFISKSLLFLVYILLISLKYCCVIFDSCWFSTTEIHELSPSIIFERFFIALCKPASKKSRNSTFLFFILFL